MNVPYDTASGYRDAEAYRDECLERLRDTKECLMELLENMIEVTDNADIDELYKAADDLEDYLNDVKYNIDELRNIESDYDSTL